MILPFFDGLTTMTRLIFLLAILFYIAALSGLGWILQPNFFYVGTCIGAAFAIAPMLGLSQGPTQRIIHLNMTVGTVVLFITVAVAFTNLYQWLSQGKVFLPAHMTTLIFSLGLSACLRVMQLELVKQDEQLDASTLLHGLFAGPSLALPVCVSVLLTSIVMVVLVVFAEQPFAAILHTKLVQRGVIPPIILVMFFWAIFLFLGKWLQLQSEWKKIFAADQLNIDINTAVLVQAYLALQKKGDSTAQSVERLFDLAWQKADFFLSVPRYINWSIPILGFIGTVLGISLAAESIGLIISTSETSLSSGLGAAISPLGIAFDTTLVALTLSVVLMLVQTLFQRWEDRNLSDAEQLFKSRSLMHNSK